MLKPLSVPFFATLLVIAPSVVLAQPMPPDEQGRAPIGGFTLQRIDNGFAISADFKITDVDGNVASLAGVYGGWVMDRRLLLGAGAYWLTGGSVDIEIAYGGAVGEWFANLGGLIDVSVRGLVGAGSATLTDEVQVWTLSLRRRPRFFGRGAPDEIDGVRDVRFSEGFFIAEPQVNILVSVADWFRIAVGGGYRFIGGARGFEDRLRGATATIGLQFRLP